jgi:hypothetical protein
MDAVLTPQDKERILHEEMYRREVKAQLEKDNGGKKGGNLVWTFLNSPFFLWFLSSVVLAGISYYYTNRDERKTLAREQRAAIRKLDAEISNRLMYFVNSIQFKKSPDKKVFTFVHEPPIVKDSVRGIEDPTATGYKVNVFPEYAGRSLRSLLIDLVDMIPDQEKPEIEEAYKQIVFLQSVYLRAKQIEDEKGSDKTMPLQSQQDADLLELDKAFNLKRWGQPFDNGITSLFFRQDPLESPRRITVPKW